LTDDPASPWTQVGGTNFGAAAWAAMIALTDQGRAAAGKIAVSTDETLRKLYALPASDFHNAGASPYDNGLGLGTPVANDLIPDLIGASAILSGGALSVTGTSGNDSISLSALSGTLTVGVNGSDSAFDNSRLTSIVVDALDGNDTVTVGRGIIGATLMGGNGNNSLVGGAGADSITGGVGSDTMIGGAGNDSLDGGAGNDLLEGDGGNDALTSNSGNSNAGGSNSTLIGGNGNDALTVGAGNNELFGDPGNDILYADSRMANTLYGGGGNDTATIDDLGLDQIPNGDIQTIIDGH
jgi:Ca2+-binding RTX toxin-like protein